MEAFYLAGEHIALNKLLKATGLCATGGMAKIAIEDGRVKVDGQVEYKKRCKIRKGQTVEYEGQVVQVVEPSP